MHVGYKSCIHMIWKYLLSACEIVLICLIVFFEAQLKDNIIAILIFFLINHAFSVVSICFISNQRS